MSFPSPLSRLRGLGLAALAAAPLALVPPALPAVAASLPAASGPAASGPAASGPAASGPVASGPVAPGAGSSASTVTLITGDRVTTTADGGVQVRDPQGRLTGYLSYRKDGDTYVYPGVALPHLA